ncbi:MAG: RNA pseudouridine synthase [Phycisphaerae bacterium]|nr:RNA pseudouridine synthase [Phycisphaerae bacterium]
MLRLTDADAVVVKPAGLSSEAPGGGSGGGTRGALRTGARGGPRTLIDIARQQLGWPDAQLPHRLDRPTRGLVVVARDRTAVAAHSQAIREGRWTKHYVARIGVPPEFGDPHSLVGEHRAYIRREGKLARLVRSGGDPARLTCIMVVPDVSFHLLRNFHALIRLDTGRYHQIRAMFAALGAPLVGDADYGGDAGRFYLEHASLSFPDPASGKLVRVFDPHDPDREPMHVDLTSALAALE